MKILILVLKNFDDTKHKLNYEVESFKEIELPLILESNGKYYHQISRSKDYNTAIVYYNQIEVMSLLTIKTKFNLKPVNLELPKRGKQC